VVLGRSISVHGWYCCDWNEAGRDNFITDESVEQGRFASLKLPDTSYVETSFGNPHCELTRFLGDWIGPKFLSEIGKPKPAGGAIQVHGCFNPKASAILDGLADFPNC
jgi:hypothetical protein